MRRPSSSLKSGARTRPSRSKKGYADTVIEMTNGGAEVVFDYVGERGAQDDAWKMTREAGSHYVIGYGGKVEIPTIDIISTERSVIGNLVGTYNDLAELMNLTAQGPGRAAHLNLPAGRGKRRHPGPQLRQPAGKGNPDPGGRGGVR